MKKQNENGNEKQNSICLWSTNRAEEKRVEKKYIFGAFNNSNSRRKTKEEKQIFFVGIWNIVTLLYVMKCIDKKNDSIEYSVSVFHIELYSKILLFHVGD